MDNLSLFAESLKDLMTQQNVKINDICAATKINDTVIYDWLKKASMPNLNSLVALSDYFQCPVDYLCGRIDSYQPFKPVIVSSFSDRLRLLINKSGVSIRKLSAETKISTSGIQRFLSGTGKPLLENLVRLAVFFDCPIDYLLGRCDKN